MGMLDAFLITTLEELLPPRASSYHQSTYTYNIKKTNRSPKRRKNMQRRGFTGQQLICPSRAYLLESRRSVWSGSNRYRGSAGPSYLMRVLPAQRGRYPTPRPARHRARVDRLFWSNETPVTTVTAPNPQKRYIGLKISCPIEIPFVPLNRQSPVPSPQSTGPEVSIWP